MDSDAKQNPHERSPRTTVEAAHQVVSPPSPPSNYQIIVRSQRCKQSDVRRVELSVPVGEQNEGQSRRA